MTKNKRSEIASSENHLIPDGYKKFLDDLKIRILSSQIKAAVRVNEELIKLYWEIGQEIVERQEKEEWGTQVLKRLSRDLRNAFPGGGFSRTNVFRMRAFYLAYQKVPQVVGKR